MTTKDETIALQAQTISNLTIALLDAQKDRDYASHEAVEASKRCEALEQSCRGFKDELKEAERELADLKRKDDAAKLEEALSRLGGVSPSKDYAISITNPLYT